MDIRQSPATGASRSDLLVQPGRPVAADVPQRPAPSSAPLEPAVQLELSEDARKADPEPQAKRQFSRDPETEALVYQVIDPVSGELFMQLPDEATLKARIYAREMESRANASAGSTVAIA